MARPRYQVGSLKSIGEKCWRIRWREDVVKQDGTLRRVYHAQTLRKMKKSDAQEILDAHLNAVKKQRRQPQIAMPFLDFVNMAWRPNATLQLRKSSMRIYTFNLDNHILDAIGEVPFRDIRRSDIESCLSRLQQKGYAVRRCGVFAQRFRRSLEAAVADRYIANNPAHGIRIREADSKREPRYYRPPEVRRLLLKLEGHAVQLCWLRFQLG